MVDYVDIIDNMLFLTTHMAISENITTWYQWSGYYFLMKDNEIKTLFRTTCT